MNNNILVSIELQSCVAHTYIFMKTFRVMFMAYLKFKLSGCPVCCLIILLGSPDRSGACFPSPSVPMVSAARAPPNKNTTLRPESPDQVPPASYPLTSKMATSCRLRRILKANGCRGPKPGATSQPCRTMAFTWVRRSVWSLWKYRVLHFRRHQRSFQPWFTSTFR